MNTADTYEAGLLAAMAVINSLATERGRAADHALNNPNYDAVQGARFVGEHGGIVDAYSAVNRLINDHLKAGAA